MTRVVLYHHVQGLTPGVVAFADRLRAEGHDVETPDLFDGRTFDSIEAGVAYAQDIAAIIERGVQAAARIGGPAVYGGFSLGVLPAQQLAQTQDGAIGALLFHSCVPVSEFGDGWPAEVPVQIHAMENDPFFVDDGDIDAARTLVEQVDAAELFLYPGSDHLFADESLTSYDADASSLMIGRVIDFLSRLPSTTGDTA